MDAAGRPGVLEFVGHGAFGVITKAGWVPYFGVVEISEWLAYRLMPVIGTVDIAPRPGCRCGRSGPRCCTWRSWGLLTASIRPLSGEPLWEFLARAPNWAVPLAFLYVRGAGRDWKEWLS